MERAGRRLRRWRGQPPFDTGDWFAQRLALDGVTEDEVLHFLREPADAVKERFPTRPGWLLELGRACSSFEHSSGPSWLEGPDVPTVVGFLNPISPLVNQGMARLREGAEELASVRATLPF
jgi:hypothetical protein